MNALRSRVKKQLLANRYCRFALVNKLLPDEVLLHDKPAVIYNELCDLAGNRAEELKPKAFYAWLSRYRKKRKSVSEGSISVSPSVTKDWRQYKPASIVDSGAPVEDVTIEFVKSINS
ncbi:MAG TPA: hypothetical protein DCQ50_07910 [Chryseobacterium sp.]|nr:hypothetical protein [Chryseobacterium sp.]